MKKPHKYRARRTLVSEADFQRTVIDLAKLGGWRVHAERKARSNKGWRTPIQGDPGWPDLVLVRDHELIFAELKSETGETSDDQDLWLSALALAGQETHVWFPSDMEEIKRRLARRDAVDEFVHGLTPEGAPR